MDGYSLRVPLLFLAHATGDWETETLSGRFGTHDESTRTHTMIFLTDAPAPAAFAPTGTVNAAEFIGVRPGLLACEGVLVDKVSRAAVTAAKVEDLVAAVRETFWRLSYRFRERAARGWNEMLHPTGDRTAVRRAHPILPAFDMADFFGVTSSPQAGSARLSG